MKPKYQLQAKNETGDKTIDIQSFTVPDSAITAGSGIVNIATATGDVTGPSSSTDNAIVRFDSTTGKVIQNSGITVSDVNKVVFPDASFDPALITFYTGYTMGIGSASLYVKASGAFQFVNTANADVFGMNASTNVFFTYKGADVASASAIVPTGNVFHVTGTTSITSITATNVPAGARLVLIFDGILTFTDGNNLKLAGDFTTSADDTITLIYDGTNFYEVARSVN